MEGGRREGEREKEGEREGGRGREEEGEREIESVFYRGTYVHALIGYLVWFTTNKIPTYILYTPYCNIFLKTSPPSSEMAHVHALAD